MSKKKKTTENTKKGRAAPKVTFHGEWPPFEPFVDRLWSTLFSRIRKFGEARFVSTVVSRINKTSGWAAMWRRTSAQKESTLRAIQSQIGMSPTADMMLAMEQGDVAPIGMIVCMTRYGQEYIDTDNIESGFKAVRDVVAGWLGIDDSDFRVSWVCRQIKIEYGKLPEILIEFYEEPKIFVNKSHVAVVLDEKEYSDSDFKILGEAGFGLTRRERLELIRYKEKHEISKKKIVASKAEIARAKSVATHTVPDVDTSKMTQKELWDHILNSARRK